MLCAVADPGNLVGGDAVLNKVDCQLNAKMLNPKKSVNKPFLENAMRREYI